ncbi:MAG: sulfur carrier protein ThiS [Selenomonadaceae bacterium]
MQVNGCEECVAGMTLAAYLAYRKYQPDRVVVECNQKIVARELYATWILKDTDVLEIVTFMGGG